MRPFILSTSEHASRCRGAFYSFMFIVFFPFRFIHTEALNLILISNETVRRNVFGSMRNFHRKKVVACIRNSSMEIESK